MATARHFGRSSELLELALPLPQVSARRGQGLRSGDDLPDGCALASPAIRATNTRNPSLKDMIKGGRKDMEYIGILTFQVCLHSSIGYIHISDTFCALLSRLPSPSGSGSRHDRCRTAWQGSRLRSDRSSPSCGAVLRCVRRMGSFSASCIR